MIHDRDAYQAMKKTLLGRATMNDFQAHALQEAEIRYPSIKAQLEAG